MLRNVEQLGMHGSDAENTATKSFGKAEVRDHRWKQV